MNHIPSITKDNYISDESKVQKDAIEISVVVPIFNEAQNLLALQHRLTQALEQLNLSFEVIVVDDGSNDQSLAQMRAIHALDQRFCVITFSRNFGKEIAIAAGLDSAAGKAVVIMDGDLQHPPEIIAQFAELWRQGYQNIYGQRRDRENETPLRRWVARRFYQLFSYFGEMSLPPGAGDFRLLDRQAVTALRGMGEHARFSKGLYAWIGFKSIGVPYDVEERTKGKSKFSYRKLTRFALDGIMSFSSTPLKIWTYIGSIIASFALTTAIYFLLRTAVLGADVPGFASLIVSIMFFSGVQMMSLGVLGEYVGRIFEEVKQRPLYIVAERIGFAAQKFPQDPLPPNIEKTV